MNGLPALRVDDVGILGCCGPNVWTARSGCRSVLINGRPAHRMGDSVGHLGLSGFLMEGSPDVLVEDGEPGTDDDGEPEDEIILAVAIEAIGGVPLAGELIAVIDPDTDEEVARARADHEGKFRVRVPDAKDYDLEILDGELEIAELLSPPPADQGDVTHLHCQFIDEEGEPVKNAAVSIVGPHCYLETTTDPDGEVCVIAEPGPYELWIRGECFVAYALRIRERNHAHAESYLFVVGQRRWMEGSLAAAEWRAAAQEDDDDAEDEAADE